MVWWDEVRGGVGLEEGVGGGGAGAFNYAMTLVPGFMLVLYRLGKWNRYGR